MLKKEHTPKRLKPYQIRMIRRFDTSLISRLLGHIDALETELDALKTDYETLSVNYADLKAVTDIPDPKGPRQRVSLEKQIQHRRIKKELFFRSFERHFGQLDEFSTHYNAIGRVIDVFNRYGFAVPQSREDWKAKEVGALQGVGEWTAKLFEEATGGL